MREGDIKLLVLPAKNELYAYDAAAEAVTQYLVEIRELRVEQDEAWVVDISQTSRYYGVEHIVKLAWLAELTEDDEYD